MSALDARPRPSDRPVASPDVEARLPRPRREPDRASRHVGDDEFVVAPSQPAPGVIVVRLQGELDLLTVPRARRVLLAATDAVAAESARTRARGPAAPERVLCDLDGLEFLSACGLGMLVELVSHARAHDVEFALIVSRARVLRVLELTGLGRFFVVLPAGGAVPQNADGAVS